MGIIEAGDGKSFLQKQREAAAEPTYEKGMTMLGLSAKEVDRLKASFEKGKMPTDVTDAVVNNYEEIRALHPDNYPFEASAYDHVSNGLE